MTRRARPTRPGAQPLRAAPPVSAPDDTSPAADADRAHWGSLHRAWQKAINSRGASSGKEPLPAVVVIAIAEHRMRATGVLGDALTHDRSLRERINALHPHARDAQGRNWNVPGLVCGTPPRSVYEAAFRQVVDALRDQFDLA